MANINLDYSASNVFNNGDGSFRKYTYRDIGTSKIVNYVSSVDGKVKILDDNTSCYDDRAIRNSLINLFMFKPGQNILQPQFGNKLYRYLYQPMMQMTADKIIRTIKQMIDRWQPRISLLETPIQADEQNSTYYIKLKYYIPLLDKQSSLTIAINKDGSNFN